MDLAGKTADNKTPGPAISVPSIVEPLELSRRWDSSRPERLEVPVRPSEAVPKSVGRRTAELAVIDRRRVDEAATWISAKVAATLRTGAEDVGEYVLDTFFSGDSSLAISRNPNKSASYRALAAKCGTAELPISKTWLNNAVGIAILNRRLPEGATAFRQLPTSFQQALLPIRDPERIESIAENVATKELTCRELREVVAEYRASKRPRRGSSCNRVCETIARIERLTNSLADEGGEKRTPSPDLWSLKETQKAFVLRSVRDLVVKLKGLEKALARPRRVG